MDSAEGARNHFSWPAMARLHKCDHTTGIQCKLVSNLPTIQERCS